MLETLQAQLENVRNAIAKEGEEDAIKMLQAEEAGLLAKIAEIENQQTIETTANDIALSMETFRVGDIDFPLDALAADADALAILRQGIAEKSQQQAQKWLNDINVQKSVYEEKVTSLTAELEEAKRLVDQYHEDNAQLHMDNEDLSEKRDAAVRSAEEAQAEANRLAIRVSMLESQLASAPTANAVVEISSTEELQAAAQRLREKQEAANKEREAAANAAKIRIYGMQQIDGTGAKFSAYRADNDEFITFGWLEKNKYIELTPDEVSQFRQEIEEANKLLVEPIAPEEPIQVEPPVSQFPTQDEPAVPEHSVHGEVASEPTEEAKTIKERLTALEIAVFGKATKAVA